MPPFDASPSYGGRGSRGPGRIPRSDLLIVGNDAPRASRRSQPAPKRPEARCSKCGTTFTADSAFCRVCGAKRATAAASRDQPRQSSPSLRQGLRRSTSPQSSRSKRTRPESAPSSVHRDYLPDVIQGLLPDHQDLGKRPALVTPEKVLANLRRLRLRSGVRVRDIQDLTRHQRDGKLTVAEFRSLLHEVGIKVDDELAQDTFAQVDRGGHHKISWAELWAAMAPTPSDILKELRVAMNKKRLTVTELIQPYDSNADHVLTPGEFHKMLDGLGFELDEGEVRHLLHQIDLDGNRQISRKELEHALDQIGGVPSPKAVAKESLAFRGDELVPPKEAPASPALAMGSGLPEGAGKTKTSPALEPKSQTTGILDDIFQEFNPKELLIKPSAASSSKDPKEKTTRPPSLEDILYQLRNLRLVRGVSLADLKSTCDASGDLKLTKEDLFKILMRVGIQLDASLAGQVFDFIDRNGNGKISWEEVWEAARPSVDEVLQVLKAIREQRGLSIERLLRQHDSSGDDKLAFSEFQKLLQALSIDIDEKTAAEVFKGLDRDGDQQLSANVLVGKGMPTPAVENVMFQLRNLRLIRGISLADLKSTCDVSGDLKLTKEDLFKILMRVGIQLDASLAGQVFDFIDRNGNGKISWEEVWEAARPSVDEVLQVLKAIREQRGLSIERLLRQHDSSGDDKLAFSEFQKLLQALSIDIDEKTAAGVFKRLDRDGDQQLSLRTLFGGDSRGGAASPQRGGSPKERIAAVLDDYLTRDQLRDMIIEAGVAAENEEGLLNQIFQEIDINRTGRVPRRELWQKLDRFLPSDEEVPMPPRMPSPRPATLPPPGRHESPRSASGHPLGSQAWELLHRIYRRLAGQESSVSTMCLIEEIRGDVHVRQERLLDRPVVGIAFGQGPSISLDAALQHVLRQVAGERSVLENTTWERFNWLLIEAQRFAQMAEIPRLDPRVTPPERRESPLPSPNDGWSKWVLSAGGSMSSCPNPDEEPGGAIEWLASELGFDRDILYRLFDMFRQGADRPRLVQRDRFLHLVQASPRLQAAVMTTPLINSTQVIQPMNWGDFLWYLSQVDALSVSWSDILATACWCRIVSLGLASGQRHPSQMSPRVSVAESRARLDEYRRRAASPTRLSSPSSPSRPAIPSTSLPAVQKLAPKIPSNFNEGSPLAAVESRFARAAGSGPQRMSRHPFLPDADDDFPSAFRGSYSDRMGPVPMAEMPHPPPPPPLAEPSGPDSYSKRLRFQVNRDYDPSERDRIAAELRKILDMRIRAVKWQDASGTYSEGRLRS